MAENRKKLPDSTSVYEYLKTNGPKTTHMIAQHFGIYRSDAEKLLAGMKASGEIKSETNLLARDRDLWNVSDQQIPKYFSVPTERLDEDPVKEIKIPVYEFYSRFERELRRSEHPRSFCPVEMKYKPTPLDPLIPKSAFLSESMEHSKSSTKEPYPKMVVAISTIYSMRRKTWDPVLVMAFDNMNWVHASSVDNPSLQILYIARGLLIQPDPLVDEVLSMALQRARNPRQGWPSLSPADLVVYLETGNFPDTPEMNNPFVARFRCFTKMPEQKPFEPRRAVYTGVVGLADAATRKRYLGSSDEDGSDQENEENEENPLQEEEELPSLEENANEGEEETTNQKKDCLRLSIKPDEYDPIDDKDNDAEDSL